jgi:hypothetical protein
VVGVQFGKKKCQKLSALLTSSFITNDHHISNVGMSEMYFVYIVAKVVCYLLKTHEVGLLQGSTPCSGWLMHPGLRFMLFSRCAITRFSKSSCNIDLLSVMKF